MHRSHPWMGKIFIALNDFKSKIHKGRMETLWGIHMEQIVPNVLKTYLANECTEVSPKKSVVRESAIAMTLS